MRKSAIATSLILTVSIAVFIADMTQQGYMVFTSVSDIKKTFPNINPPHFAKVLDGDDKGCLTKPSQTKPVTVAQIRTLRQLTDPDAIATLLGNPLCQTEKGAKWITESGKILNLKLGETLDYDFSTGTSQSLTNQERTSAKANGLTNSTLQHGLSAPSSIQKREPTKIK
jgi:hypothetical protein